LLKHNKLEDFEPSFCSHPTLRGCLGRERGQPSLKSISSTTQTLLMGISIPISNASMVQLGRTNASTSHLALKSFFKLHMLCSIPACHPRMHKHPFQGCCSGKLSQ